MKSKKATEMRSILSKRESDLSRELEEHTSVLDSDLSKNMKTIALLGAGLAIGFVVYKLLNSKKINTEKKTHINTKPVGIKSTLMSGLLAGVIRGLVPIVLDKMSKSESDEKNIKTARAK